MTADFRTYYSVRNADQFRPLGLDWPAFYARADELTAAARASLTSDLDVPYGEDAKQALDVYHPRIDAPSEAVVVFLHGGGFREGDRAHYGFVAPALAERGIPTVVPSYHLLPDGDVDDALDDAVAAVRWVADRYPDRAIVLTGHSAGGALTGRIGADRGGLLGADTGARITGILPISSNYDFTGELVPPYLDDTFRDEQERVHLSPLHQVADPAPRALVAVGGEESPYVPLAERFAETLRKGGSDASSLVLPGQRHDQTVFAISDPDSDVFAGLVGMSSGAG